VLAIRLPSASVNWKLLETMERKDRDRGRASGPRPEARRAIPQVCPDADPQRAATRECLNSKSLHCRVGTPLTHCKQSSAWHSNRYTFSPLNRGFSPPWKFAFHSPVEVY